MSITKEELVSVINSYASARASGDPNLINFSAKFVEQAVSQIDFGAEAPVPEAVVSDDAPLEDSVGG